MTSLRRIGVALAVIAAVLAVWLSSTDAHAQAPQTTVRTTSNRVVVEYDHGVEGEAVIEARLAASLSRAAQAEEDPNLRGIMQAYADSPERIRTLIRRVGDSFDAATNAHGLTDASTLSIVSVDVIERDVEISVINILFLPPDIRDRPLLRDHEEGHAIANNLIAERLGPVIARQFIGEDDAAGRIGDELEKLRAEASTQYDAATRRGTTGGQAIAALDAVNDVVAATYRAFGLPLPTPSTAPAPAAPSASPPRSAPTSVPVEPLAPRIPCPPPPGPAVPDDGSVNGMNARTNRSIVEASCSVVKAIDAARGMKSAAERMVTSAARCDASPYEAAVLAYGQSRDDWERFSTQADREIATAERNLQVLQAAVDAEIARQIALNELGNTVMNLRALVLGYQREVAALKDRLSAAKQQVSEADERSLEAVDLWRRCR